MKTFLQFITEAAADNKSHLTHLEDFVFDGPEGVALTLEVLNEVGGALAGGGVTKALNVRSKFDGSPSLVWGICPNDGKFFVATKGAFAKNPKLAKSHTDIDQMYQSGVKDILHQALDFLPLLNPTCALQGDVMFAADGMKKIQMVGGESCITFCPNTIMYAVPVNSAMGQRILKAKFGIVLYTMFTGSGNFPADYKQTPISPSVLNRLSQTSQVMVYDNVYDDASGSATFTHGEQSAFVAMLGSIASAASHIRPGAYALVITEPIKGLLATFINSHIRQNKLVSAETAVDDFIVYLQAERDKEISSRKTSAGQDAQSQRFAAVVAAVESQRGSLMAMFMVHALTERAKMMVVKKLNQVADLKTFAPDGNGFAVTSGEGYVAVSHQGHLVKFVDRLNFSRLNFQSIKSWK
jgi:hypothetical protein